MQNTGVRRRLRWIRSCERGNDDRGNEFNCFFDFSLGMCDTAFQLPDWAIPVGSGLPGGPDLVTVDCSSLLTDLDSRVASEEGSETIMADLHYGVMAEVEEFLHALLPRIQEVMMVNQLRMRSPISPELTNIHSLKIELRKFLFAKKLSYGPPTPPLPQARTSAKLKRNPRIS